jgi:predicted NBD/HSP70 family sugar kinase
MVFLGIDIGGTSAKLAAISGDGRVLWTGQSAFYGRPTTQQLIDALKDAAKGRVTQVDAAGICVPGLLDRQRRLITLSVNVPGLNEVKLDDLAAAAFGALPSLEIVNDAVATATDVIAARGLSGRVVSIALGTGVGMGVLDDGVPLYVDGASPGHIGQVDCSIEGEPAIGPDGGAGSLEGYIGVPALIKKYGSTKIFLEVATANDAAIKGLVRAIRICHGIYRPHHVVLVGGIGTRLARLVPDIQRAVAINLSSIARPGWTLSSGDDDFHAARGAARLAMQATGEGA